jgi:hypothetical protein
VSWISIHAQTLVKAYEASDWAGLFGNWLVIGSLSIAILFWAMFSAVRLRVGVRRLRSVLDRSTARLSETPRQAHEFAAYYEAVAATLQDAQIVGPAWRDWSATLITSGTPATPVRSTNRPDSYFSLGLLRSCGINPRLHAAMPNLLVGVGLLLTFLGLALALSSAGSIADQTVSAADRQSGLKTLLDVASAKFVTSLVGLFCSLAYTTFRSQQLVNAERALDRFLAALEERIPLATPAGLQVEANSLLEKSLLVQSQFTNEVAVNIGGLLDSALDQRLGEHIGPLRDAIERLSEGIGTKSEDTLRTLLEQFREMLQGSAQQHMEKLATALADTSGAMEQIRSGLSEAAARMASAADQIAEQMGRKADQAMAGITLQMEGLVHELRTLAEQSRAAGNDAMAQAAARIAEAGESFGNAARSISTSLEQTVAGITERLGGEAEAATRRMTEELTRAIGAMRDLAEQNRSAGTEATQAMSDRIAQAAAGFERSAAQVAEALTSGAGDAAGRLTAAVEELRDHFVRLAADLTSNIANAGTQFEKQGRDGASALADAAQAAAAALRIGGQESGEALRTGGTDASRGIQTAAGELATPVRELGQRVAALQTEALELGRSLIAMRQATIDATAPLQAAAADLVKVGASGQKTAADLAVAAQRIVPLADAVTGAMQKLGEAESRLAALSKGLESALQGFSGLDASLGLVFKNLSAGLSGFALQVTDFVNKTNQDMAQAVTTLHSAIEELREAQEETTTLKAADKR